LVGSLLLGLYDDEGSLHHVGFTSGLKAAEKRDLTEKLEKMRAKRSFTGNSPGAPGRWSRKRSTEWIPVRPKFVVEVSYDHFSGDRFRHGTTIVRWRPDKRPGQCTMKQLKTPGKGIRLCQFGEFLLTFLVRDALSFLSRFREPDRYGLLSAFNFAAFPTPAAFRSTPLIAPHLDFDCRPRRV
jgi:hypothetical protein